MPKPPKMQYEKVPVNDLIPAVIDDIEYEEKHEFIWKGKTVEASAVRFFFNIEGCKHLHQSRWMKFFYLDKSTLLKKYVMPLVEGAKANMDFDLNHLKGMKIKMLWVDGKDDYQNIESIMPFDKKLPFTAEEAPPTEAAGEGPVSDEEPIPF